ncbi:hypothetical protein CKO51_09870 [Rhodopirellula sp. SM50]|nr:hypothetical protein [Rhodopirellula sp. SM50]PAY19707.1 hypothetical protein CKO51_09870 [Rhodopirellula sp. SM50]
MDLPESIESRLKTYTELRKSVVVSGLGQGTQGSVVVCSNLSQQHVAVKFHERSNAYFRERDVYLRLSDLEITHVQGLRIPILVHFDDDLLAIEMTIVSPPFCLDFGGAYLDRPPDYTPEVWRDWREQKSEDFEEDWPVVQEILAEFESFGIYIADVNPGNIRFRNNT